MVGGGGNESGELGLGHKNKTLIPTLIKTNIVDFAAGSLYALAVDTAGDLWAWGDNEYGSLGIGNNVSTLIPVFVCGNIKKVASTCRYSSAIDVSDHLLSWGDNGNGWYDASNNYESFSTKERVSPELILNDIKFMTTSVSGGTYNYAIGNNGCLWYWTISNPKSPKLEGISQIKEIYTPQDLIISKNSLAVIPLEINPVNGEYHYIEWHSDNEEIVKCISPDVIMGNKQGETNIKATVVGENGVEYSSITHIIVEDKSAGTDRRTIGNNTDIEVYNLQGLYCGECIKDLTPGIYIIRKRGISYRIIIN